MQENSQNQSIDANEQNINEDDSVNEKKFQDQFSSKKKDDNKVEEESNNEDTIKKLEEDIVKANDRALRALAELENNRKMAKIEMEKTIKFGISKLVNDIIVVAENFFLASNNAPKEELEASDGLKNYFNAISMTENELVKVLEKNGVKRIYPMDQNFDHNLHEALSQVESDKKEGTIIQVIQAGYSLNERLLKPALVAVAKPKA